MQLTPGLHGLLSLALLLVLGNIVYFTVHVPAREHLARLDERLDSLSFQRDRYRRVAGSRATIEKELSGLKASTEQLDQFITAPSSTLAVAELQNRLKSLIEQQGGNIISLHPQPVTNGQPFEKLTLRLQFGSDIKSLQNILHDLAEHKPVFFIDEMLIQSRVSRGGPEDSLQTRVVISAYRNGPRET